MYLHLLCRKLTFGVIQLETLCSALTCMVHIRSSVKGGGATGLDLPSRASVLWCPAAEGWIIGPAEVTGKPEKSCKCVEQRLKQMSPFHQLLTKKKNGKELKALTWRWPVSSHDMAAATLKCFSHSFWSVISTRGQQRTAEHTFWIPQHCVIKNRQLRREKPTRCT